MIYPDARREAVSDTLTGISFPDPYHWLEHESPEVREWQRRQAALASAYVRDWPHFECLRESVGRFSGERMMSAPRYGGGCWFRMHYPEGASQAQAVVSEQPMGAGRVLWDARIENSERPPFLSWISPSPNGRTLALGVCADGSENNTIRLIDVATGNLLADAPPHTLMDSLTGTARWFPDSSGFFFGGITGAPTNFDLDIYLHRRTRSGLTMRAGVPWTLAKDIRIVTVAGDGRYAVAFERWVDPIPIAIAALTEAPLRWRPFVSSVAGRVAGEIIGNRFIAVTTVGAPRGRLISIPLDVRDANDPRGWQELVPESDAVLTAMTFVGQVLYLTEYVDTYVRVRIADLHGKIIGEVPLPERGAVSCASPLANLLPREHPDKLLFAFSSLTVSPGLYAHTPGQRRIETLQQPKVRLEKAVVEDRWARSKDGTRVPYHVVRRRDVDAERPQPTLIYAYGAYGIPLSPGFPGPMAAIVAAGGAFVHAHLRGGGEFGLDWWHDGRMRRKQNCYDDLYAIAEDLISAKLCTSQMLAVTGASGGGLTVGVAAAQRPDLWKVVVPRVPSMDLIGSCREPYGRMAILMDYANIDDPEEVRRLATISPYHLLRDGVRYPAVYLDAGDTDPRCPPWHARKFAARLQRATQGGGPILLHVWENVGHGLATDKNIALIENTEWLAFTFRHLGLEPHNERRI